MIVSDLMPHLLAIEPITTALAVKWLLGAIGVGAVAGTAYLAYKYENRINQILQKIQSSRVWKVMVTVYKAANRVRECYEFVNSWGSIIHSESYYDSWSSTPSDVQQRIDDYGEYSVECELS